MNSTNGSTVNSSNLNKVCLVGEHVLPIAKSEEWNESSGEAVRSMSGWPLFRKGRAVDLAGACAVAQQVSACRAALGVLYVQESLARLVHSLLGVDSGGSEEYLHRFYLGPASFGAVMGGVMRFTDTPEYRRLAVEQVLISYDGNPVGITGVADGPDETTYAFVMNTRPFTGDWSRIELLGLTELTLRRGSCEWFLEHDDIYRCLQPHEAKLLRQELETTAALLEGAVCLGIAQAALDWAMDYSRERVAFGKPICQHQAVALRLADSVISLEAARVLLLDTAAAEPGDRQARAGAAHNYAGQQAFHAVLHALRVAGGHGYLRRNPVERWLREVQTLRILNRWTKVE